MSGIKKLISVLATFVLCILSAIGSIRAEENPCLALPNGTGEESCAIWWKFTIYVWLRNPIRLPQRLQVVRGLLLLRKFYSVRSQLPQWPLLRLWKTQMWHSIPCELQSLPSSRNPSGLSENFLFCFKVFKNLFCHHKRYRTPDRASDGLCVWMVTKCHKNVLQERLSIIQLAHAIWLRMWAALSTLVQRSILESESHPHPKTAKPIITATTARSCNAVAARRVCHSTPWLAAACSQTTLLVSLELRRGVSDATSRCIPMMKLNPKWRKPSTNIKKTQTPISDSKLKRKILSTVEASSTLVQSTFHSNWILDLNKLTFGNTKWLILLFYPESCVHRTENKRDIIKFSEEQRVEIELRALPIQFSFPLPLMTSAKSSAFQHLIFFILYFINLLFLSLSGYKAKRRKIIDKWQALDVTMRY